MFPNVTKLTAEQVLDLIPQGPYSADFIAEQRQNIANHPNWFAYVGFTGTYSTQHEFAFAFDDSENALVPTEQPIYAIVLVAVTLSHEGTLVANIIKWMYDEVLMSESETDEWFKELLTDGWV